MATLTLFKDAFPGDTTQAQKDLALAFGNALLACAGIAARQLGAANDSGGKFGLKLMERFEADNPKPHRFYRASVGSTIERSVYTYLLSATAATRRSTGEDMMDAMDTGAVAFTGCYEGQLPSGMNVTFALEYTAAVPNLLPCSFKNSRPDIRLSLGAGTTGTPYEALFDLTSEKQRGHVLKKRDNWVAKANVTLIAEVIWLDNDIMGR